MCACVSVGVCACVCEGASVNVCLRAPAYARVRAGVREQMWSWRREQMWSWCRLCQPTHVDAQPFSTTRARAFKRELFMRPGGGSALLFCTCARTSRPMWTPCKAQTATLTPLAPLG
eukprot:2272846-Pleurochrysis_carterae.AAC.1